MNASKGGEFRLGDRKTKTDVQIQEVDRDLTLLDIKQSSVEQAIDDITQSAKQERRDTVREAIKTLSETQLDTFKQGFEQILEVENNS